MEAAPLGNFLHCSSIKEETTFSSRLFYLGLANLTAMQTTWISVCVVALGGTVNLSIL